MTCVLLQIFVFAIMPFMVWLLTFIRKNDSDARLDERHNQLLGEEDILNRDADSANLKPTISVTCSSKKKYEISYFRAMYRGFTSPIVKCIHYSVSIE